MTTPLWLGSFSGGKGSADSSGASRRARPELVQPKAANIADPDAELVARLLDTDESVARAAFERIFRTHYPILCEFATRYVEARDIASDVVADVFVRIWERRHAWELHVTLRAYLYGAVANAARNRRRDIEREHRRVTRSVADGGDPAWMSVRAPTSDVIAVNADLSDRLWSVIHGLGDDASVLLLRWRHALDYDEIARILGISAAAAQRRHSRAMARLREALPDLFREDVE